MRTVYIAHAIDYTDRSDHEARWFHNYLLDDWQVWCPYCHFKPGEPAEATMQRNMRALAFADALIASIDVAAFSFGTPVEVWTKAMTYSNGKRVCIIHPARPGLFVKYLEQNGVTVVQSSREAVAWLAQTS